MAGFERKGESLPQEFLDKVEETTGVDLSDVRVHRNVPKPAQISAHAYAYGPDIYIGPGQEEHLPHEAWHVVQQRQGRVKAAQHLSEPVPAAEPSKIDKAKAVLFAQRFGELAKK